MAFYATQARSRLAGSRKARRFARLALQRAWEPVGSSIMDDDEVRHVMAHLFAGPDGRKEIEAIDRHLTRLPGMDGLTIVADAMDERGITG